MVTLKKYISFLLVLCMSFPALAMNPGAQNPAPQPAITPEVRQAIDQAMAEVRNVQQQFPQINQQAQLGIQQYHQAVADRLRWQNTLRKSWQIPIPGTNYHIPLGIYNRDLVNLGDMAVHYAADYYLYRQLYKKRIDHVYKTVMEQSSIILEWLEKIDEHLLIESLEASVEQLKKKKEGLFSRLFSRKKTPQNPIEKFKDYIKNSEQLIGNNPFNRELLLPLAATIGTSQLSSYIKDQIVNGSMREEAFNRYEMRNGRLEALPFPPPISVVPLLGVAGSVAYSLATDPILTLFFLPIVGLQLVFEVARDYIGEQNLNGATRFGTRMLFPEFSRNYPWVINFIFSKPFSVILQTLMTGYALKLMDQWYDSIWFAYILKNIDGFKTVVEKYDRLKKEHEAYPDDLEIARNLKAAEFEILEFIQKGHAIKSIIPTKSLITWLQTKKWATGLPATIGGFGLAYYLVYKIRQTFGPA